MNKRGCVSDAPNLSAPGEAVRRSERAALVPTRALQPCGALIIQSSLVRGWGFAPRASRLLKEVNAAGGQTAPESNKRKPPPHPWEPAGV